MSAKLNSVLLACIQLAIIFDLATAHTQCNTCGNAGIACTSENDYVICDCYGVPDPNIGATCPSYAYCDLDVVCANITAGSTPSCIPPSLCGVCTPDLRFACVDTNKFQMCYGTRTPTSPVLTCPSNTVCNYYAAAGNFCGAGLNVPSPVCTGPNVTPTEPTTPVTQPSTGTTIDRWTSWCRSKGQTGRFAYTSDTKCQTYIYCFVNNSLLFGNYYSCTGTAVFNPNLQACVPPESYACPA